jgi:dTDP-4-amino-4,6-dideoxygalactose transaminase
VRIVPVPLFATRAEIEPLLPRIEERVVEVLRSGRYVLGPEGEAFEGELAGFLGAAHCVGVANGTDALTIALRALGVKRGDEVVVPAVTFYATAEAVVNAGARPVFADVDTETWCVTAATVEPVLSERTTAIVPVHLFGNPAPVGELAALASARGGRPIRILEDAAQAIGARLDGRMAGALGDAATFSFYPSKNLGAFGDAGAIVTDDPDVADACRLLRHHGSKDKEIHVMTGYNSRLDEVQAAALRVLLPEVGRWTAARRQAATGYRELGLGELVGLPVETAGAESCYHLHVIATPERDSLAVALRDRGIGSRIYYVPPLHAQPGLSDYAPERALPGADQFAAETLAIPMGPALARDQIEEVVTAAAATLRPAATA